MKVKPRAARPARRLVHVGPLPHVTVFRPAQYKLSPDAAVWDKKRNQFWKKLCADFSFPNCEEMQRLIRELESEYIEPAAPTPDTLDKLSKSLDTVLDLLQRKENEHEILCALGWRPGLTIDEYESITDKYESLVRGLHVRGLYKISDHLRRRPSSKQKRGAPNKIRDLKDFVARLADIWEGQTGRKATQEWHTKKKGEHHRKPFSEWARFTYDVVEDFTRGEKPNNQPSEWLKSLPTATGLVVKQRRALDRLLAKIQNKN
jgi:hypothetical protein